MKTFIMLLCAFMLSFSGVFAYETEHSYSEIERELLRSESELRTKVYRGTSYLRQLNSILPALQSDTEQMDKIFARMQMLRQPERFENMSASAQILIDYIYYKILFLTTEPEEEEEYTPESGAAGAVKLSSFPLYTGESWLAGLDVKVSEKGFTTVYFNTESGVKSHPFTLAQMQLTGSGMSQDISAFQDAGVSMAGYVHIDLAGGYEFTLSQSGGETELILAGYLILSAQQDDSVIVHLEPGKYLLELQYINDADTLDIGVQVGQ